MNQKVINAVCWFVRERYPREHLHFHTLHHAKEVSRRAGYLSQREGCDAQTREMLMLAGLFHDIGYIIDIREHERLSASIAGAFLTREGYATWKIKKIQRLILATEFAYRPKTLTERIMRDADMDNIGRDDFFDYGDNLRKELLHYTGQRFSDKQWYQKLLGVLQYSFYTTTARRERRAGHRKNLHIVKELLKCL